MTKQERQLESVRVREEVSELRQEVLALDQRLLRLIEKIRRDLCNAGLELTQDPMARLKKWQDSGIVEAGDLVRETQKLQSILAQKERALKDYDEA